MIEHANEIIPLLVWMIVTIGGGLLALLIWIGQRIQKKVDDLPEQISEKVRKVHDDILERMDTLNATQSKLEQDIRERLARLDRRVVRLEVRCEMNHGTSGNGDVVE